jgi:predicted transcriptional regulator
MNYNNDNGDNGKESLEREFAEKSKLIQQPLPYQTAEELYELGTTKEKAAYWAEVGLGLREALPDREKDWETEKAEWIEIINEELTAIFGKMFGIKEPSSIKASMEPNFTQHINDAVLAIIGKGVTDLLSKKVMSGIEIVISKISKLSKNKSNLLGKEELELITAAVVDLSARNFKIHSVDSKIILEIVERATIEDNDTIKEMYRYLLTCAIAGEKVGASDLGTLRNLDSDDILILDLIYEKSQAQWRNYDIIYRSGLNREGYEISIDRLLSQGIIQSTSIKETKTAIETALDNITRDRGASEYTASEKKLLDLDLSILSQSLQNALEIIVEAQTINKYDYIQLTNRGKEFMRKCKGIIDKPIETEQNP